MLKKTSVTVIIVTALLVAACQTKQINAQAVNDSRPVADQEQLQKLDQTGTTELLVADASTGKQQEIVVEEVVVEEVVVEEVVVEEAAPQAPTLQPKPVSGGVGKQASDPRLDYAGNLIYRSTAAQQIKSSENQQAHKLYQDAQALYQKISQHSSPEENKKLLDEALTKMFSAVQMADPEKVRAEKSRRDFTRKKDSIQALLDAHDRVAQEKKQQQLGKKMHQQIAQLLAQADALYRRGDYVQGQGILNGGLNIVKTSIEQMRGGDTLVKGLKFESKKDEYVYELDRNDTHQMLIKVLLEKKRKQSPDLDKRVRQALDLSAQYRLKAEQLAKNNDYQSAIDWLERATLELVKVIRRGGIYIPSA